MRFILAGIAGEKSANGEILLEGYKLAVQHNIYPSRFNEKQQISLTTSLQRITQEVEHSNMTINTLLMSQSLQTNNNIPLSILSIQACIQDACNRYPFTAEIQNGLKICISIDFSFYGSHNLIVLIIFNLFKNAEFAIRQAGKGNIEITTSCYENFHALSVKDTGTGIKQERLERIFDLFATNKPFGTGSGLGLSFCKRAMELIGGTIKCDAIEDVHTTITLYFPMMEKINTYKIPTAP